MDYGLMKAKWKGHKNKTELRQTVWHNKKLTWENSRAHTNELLHTTCVGIVLYNPSIIDLHFQNSKTIEKAKCDKAPHSEVRDVRDQFGTGWWSMWQNQTWKSRICSKEWEKVDDDEIWGRKRNKGGVLQCFEVDSEAKFWSERTAQLAMKEFPVNGKIKNVEHDTR